MWVCVHTSADSHGGQMRATDALVLELQAGVSFQMWGFRNRTRVLRKSSKCSELPSHLSRPLYRFFTWTQVQFSWVSIQNFQSL